MIPVFVYDKNQCDPKKCTAKRMLKFGLAKEAKTLHAIPKGSIVLSPFAEKALSPDDIRYARHGLVVMDLTWTNIDEFPRPKGTNDRALPYMLASNPINWGEFMRLNGELLEEYSSAKDSTEVVRIQNEYIDSIRNG